eukprot:EG_transcript_2846
MEILQLGEQVIQEVSGGQGFLGGAPRVYIRCSNLPITDEIHKKTVSDIRSADTHRLIVVPGTVVRTGMRKVLVVRQGYRCNKCNGRFEMWRDVEQQDAVPRPSRCQVLPKCTGTSFTPDGVDLKWDYQLIRIQDHIAQLGVGSIPRSITCLLEEDLVDSCKAGDDVLLTAIAMRQWAPLFPGVRCDVEPVLRVNALRVTNQFRDRIDVLPETRGRFEEFWRRYADRPLRGRDAILRHVCPQVFGLYLVKLCLAMTIIGGVKMEKAGTRIRGESHLLLIGDPGTAKSQFLKYASQLSARAVLTTGIGTTSAGLTVMATKDSGDWVLEAGALVLADGGICCIDEFSSISEHDRTAIHEAMEQQTLSVAKAGLVTKLSTRCTIVAATNPRGTGKFDATSSLSINTTLASPLLSRFDLVLLLVDTQNEEWDRKVSKFILERAGAPKASWSAAIKGEEDLDGEAVAGGGDFVWDLPMIQQYFAVVKAIHPVLTPEAETVLTRYYELQRQQDDRNQARTTIRLLESLVRLAQAHARLMFRLEVTRQDAVIAVIAMEGSTSVARLFQRDSALHTVFPADPDAYYVEQECLVLQALRLTASGEGLAPTDGGRDSWAASSPLRTGTPQPPPSPAHYPPATPSPHQHSFHFGSLTKEFGSHPLGPKAEQPEGNTPIPTSLVAAAPPAAPSTPPDAEFELELPGEARPPLAPPPSLPLGPTPASPPGPAGSLLDGLRQWAGAVEPPCGPTPAGPAAEVWDTAPSSQFSLFGTPSPQSRRRLLDASDEGPAPKRPSHERPSAALPDHQQEPLPATAGQRAAILRRLRRPGSEPDGPPPPFGGATLACKADPHSDDFDPNFVHPHNRAAHG